MDTDIHTVIYDFNKDITSSNAEEFYVTEIKRISSTQAEQISSNILNASKELYDRLDHDKPIINSVTYNEAGELIIKASDAKTLKYNTSDFPQYSKIETPVKEPASNGIIAYQITKSKTEPTQNWISASKTETFNVTSKAVESNGTYYAWVLDVGGNTNYKEVVVSGVEFDKTPPTLGKPNVRALEDKIEIEIKNATDDSGIKQYEFYLNDKLMATQAESKYTYSNLTDATNYTIKYTVTDNKGNKATSENISATTLEIKITEIYTVTNKCISRIKANTKKQDFLNNINSKVQAKVLTKDGKELEDTKNVGTGMKLDTTKGIFTIIITGDITGDGKISSTDIFKLKRKLVNLEIFDTIEEMASDVDYNNNVTSTDLLKTKQVCVGLLEL